jgi:hypothetical protein
MCRNAISSNQQSGVSRTYLPSLLFLALTLSSCMFFEQAEPHRDNAREAQVTEQHTGEVGSESEIKRVGLEVTWQVPSEPVDGFIIRYGASRTSLTNEKKLATSEVLREEDLEYGPVYRFTIPDIQDDSPVYVSVAAFKGDRLSDFSEVIQERAK